MHAYEQKQQIVHRHIECTRFGDYREKTLCIYKKKHTVNRERDWPLHSNGN